MDIPALRTVTRTNDGDSAGSMVLYLALFILLLAFFILLNALSTPKDEKVGLVLRSVDGAFSNRTAVTGTAGDIDRRGLIAEAATAVRRLGDQVLAQIPLAKIETVATPDGDRFVLTVPEGELFQDAAGAALLRSDRTALLHRVADVLAPRAGGIQVRLDALIAVPSDPEVADAQMRRVGALARELVKVGTPPAAMTVGLEPGRPLGTVRLVFGIQDAGGRAVRLTAEEGR